MILSAFVEVLLPVLVVVVCGFALRRVLPIDLRSLNRVSMYVLSPALIFTTLARIQVAGAEALRIAAASTLVIVLIGVLAYLCARPLQLDQATLSALLLSTMFMNAGNYGLPTTRFAFGEEGLQRALLFFIPQTILAQVLAVPIAGMARGARGNPLLQVLRMPQIYAAAAGLLARAAGINLLGEGHDVIAALFRGVALMSDAALPLLLLLLGMQLAQGVAVEQRGLTTLAVVLRLLISPLLAYGLARLLGLSDLSMRVVVLEASMPTAVNMVLYSLEFDARPGFVAGVVVVTTVLSLAMLALLLFLGGGIMLLAAIVLPIQGTNLVPWYIYLAYAAYLIAVGWGLWGARRWAYLAALLMCVVLGFYQLQTAVVLQKNALFPFLALAVMFGYLIQPKLRAIFLHSVQVTSDE